MVVNRIGRALQFMKQDARHARMKRDETDSQKDALEGHQRIAPAAKASLTTRPSSA